MHVILTIGAVLDEFRQRAVQQTELFQPLSNDFDGGVVRLVPMVVAAGLVDRRKLGFEHNLVNGALLGGEFAADRHRPGNVGSVVVDLAAGIDKEQVTVPQFGPVFDIVQRTRVSPGPDDRVVRRTGVVAAELVDEFRFDFVLEQARAHGTHRPCVRLHGDLGRSAHGRNLGTALVEAHVVQQMIERYELLRRVHAPRHSRPQRIDPAGNARVEVCVHAHCVVNACARLDDARQDVVDIVDRESVIRTVMIDRTLGPHPRAVPALLFAVPLAAEQQELAGGAPGHERGNCLRLRKTGEVIEIAVLPIAVFDIARSGADRCRGENGDAVHADHAHQLLAPAEEFLAVHLKGTGWVTGETILTGVSDLVQGFTGLGRRFTRPATQVCKLLVRQLHRDTHILDDLRIGHFVRLIVAVLVDVRTRELQHIPDDIRERIPGQPFFQRLTVIDRNEPVQKSLAPVRQSRRSYRCAIAVVGQQRCKFGQPFR